MADVSITFDADLSGLNRQISELQRTGQRAAQAVGRPMEKLLESDKRVERSLSNMTRGLAGAQNAAEGIAGALDNLENVFNTPLFVGAAAAIGVGLNQALEGAAKGANAFSAQVEKILATPAFEATTGDVERLRDQLRSLEAAAGDAGLFERWIFGGQKEAQLDAVRQALDQASQFARSARLGDLGAALGDERQRVLAAQARAEGRQDEARFIEHALRQTQELRKAEEELQAVRRRGSAEEIAAQEKIFAAIVERQEQETDALSSEIVSARRKKQTEEIERQRKLVEEMIELEERRAVEAYEKQLDAAERKGDLLRQELETQRELRDIEFERTQISLRGDRFGAAENALSRAQIESALLAGRPDVTEAEKARANLDVLRAEVALLDAAAAAGPTAGAVASSGPPEVMSLRRAAARGGLSDASRARQSQARMAFAEAERAKDPFGASTRERTDRLRRQAEIQALQAQDVLDDTLDAREANRLRQLSDADFRRESDERRLAKEQAARAKDRERKDEQAGREAAGRAEEAVPSAAEGGASRPVQEDKVGVLIQICTRIDKNMASVEKKLPQRALK